MNDFIVSVEGNLQIIKLWDIPADTDFANIIGEIVKDADTDDPLVVLRTAFPQSGGGFWLSSPLRGELIRLGELRRHHEVSKDVLNGN